MHITTLVRKTAKGLGIVALAKRLLPFGILTRISVALNASTRARVAARHLAGEGLEIGALHYPLRLPRGAFAKYVDVLPLDELLRKYPELKGSRLTLPDYVDDGFELRKISDASQEFVVANHVLEHSPNPIQVMENWARVLKPGGVLFVTVPIAEACFDRGRPETTMEHLVEDYEVCRRGDIATFAQRNLEHYVEWASISVVNQRQDAGHKASPPSREEAETLAHTLAAGGEGIHFHTFSTASFTTLAKQFAETAGFSVAEIADLGAEVVAVLRKIPRTETTASVRSTVAACHAVPVGRDN